MTDQHRTSTQLGAARPVRSLWQRARRWLRHRWSDGRDVLRAAPPELLARLAQYTTASEARHTGELRICIEAGLPSSYIWRDATPRERAITLFGKLRVWDTEHNNGVLIYLCLAENAIEIIADRAISMRANTSIWQEITNHLATHLKRGDFERGLTQALEECSALLVEHFPLKEGEQRRDEVSNAPDVRA